MKHWDWRSWTTVILCAAGGGTFGAAAPVGQWPLALAAALVVAATLTWAHRNDRRARAAAQDEAVG